MSGKALRVRFAARVRIAVRCGVFFENVREDSSEVAGLLSWIQSCFQGMKEWVEFATDGSRDSFDLMPYFASVEYNERIVCVLFGGEGRWRVPVEPTASSNIWKASSSLRYT